jgi:hypothetical protein
MITHIAAFYFLVRPQPMAIVAEEASAKMVR